MVVSELIKELQALNPNSKVVFTGCYGAESVEVSIDQVSPQYFANFDHYEESDGGLVEISTGILTG
jgi:tRNA A37 methylthiotransferase MiaB